MQNSTDQQEEPQYNNFQARHTHNQNKLSKILEVTKNKSSKKAKIAGLKEWVTLPAYSCVGKGDTVRIESNKMWVICVNGEAQIIPPYLNKKKIRKDGLDFELLFKEITDDKEFETFKNLSALHYRNHNVFGRTVKIIARSFDPAYPDVIGYIELGTALYMNKPRSAILNSPFRYKSTSWNVWDMDTQRSNINLIVRITRTVVLPEFRGLGIGRELVNSAIQYARNHWQINGMKPLFLEISADMLKYVPFVEKAGMLYIGNTEGNISRFWKDMSYLVRNEERVKKGDIVNRGSSGIVDQQVSRMNRTIRLMKEQGLTLDQTINKMKHVTDEMVLRDYDLFHEIISLPKPTYLIGLNTSTQSFIQNRISQVKPHKPERGSKMQIDPINSPIVFDKVNLISETAVRRTLKTHSIQQAFGISPSNLQTVLLNDFTMSIEPGEICLVIGPSGSSKTTLLNLYKSDGKPHAIAKMTGKITWPSNYSAGTLKNVYSNKALIEQFKNVDVETSLYLMGVVGLSDAFVYLKRFKELSKGQQYRAMIALLIASERNVWIIDEFCSNLDAVTSRAVAGGIQKIARKLGVTVIVASPRYEDFITSLSPDKVVKMSYSGRAEVIDGRSFINSLNIPRRRSEVPTLSIPSVLMREIYQNNRHLITINGKKSIKADALLLESSKDKMLVRVKRIETIENKSSKSKNVVTENSESKGDPILSTSTIGHKLKDSGIRTIIEFEVPYELYAKNISKNTSYKNGEENRGE